MICIVLSMLAIAHCADLSGQDTFQGIIHYYGGKTGLIICNVLIFVHNFGTCVTLLVIIADQMDKGN